MKIGILTLPLHTNYGGILQAYALQTVLERMGHETRHIIVKPNMKYGVLHKVKRTLAPIKRVVKLALIPDKLTSDNARHTSYFISRNVKIDMYRCIEDIPENKYDALVVGSDQIWRKMYVEMCTPFKIQSAFLDFAKSWKVKRISYAASFGTDKWECDAQETSELKLLANKFEAISVRESSGVQLCKDHFGCEATLVLDPTLLLNKEDYEKLASESRKHRSGIMTYILDIDEKKKGIIQEVCRTIGLPVYTSNIPENRRKSGRKGLVQPPVEDWLAGFRDADFVVTDSFHACVFSVIFNKPFVAIVNTERGASRFYSLLKMLNQTNRIVDEVSPTINMNELLLPPNCDLSKWRKESYKFLTKCFTI